MPLYYSKGVYRLKRGDSKDGGGMASFFKGKGRINRINKAGFLCLSSALCVSLTNINVLLNASLTANEISRKFTESLVLSFCSFSQYESAGRLVCVFCVPPSSLLYTFGENKTIIIITTPKQYSHCSIIVCMTIIRSLQSQQNICYNFSINLATVTVLQIRAGCHSTIIFWYRKKLSIGW